MDDSRDPDGPRTTPDGTPDERLLGKDEMNLAEFPITLLADRKGVSIIVREVPTRDEQTGKMVLRKVTVSGSELYGLPSAQDNLILLGLIYLTKRANNFRERRVEFSRSEIIRVLGWPDSGQSYTRIELSLKRWANVFVLYENAWWEKPRQTYSSKGFGIIDDFEIHDGSAVRSSGALKSNIAWNEVFFQSLEAGFVRTIDLKLLLRLRYPSSQQMYRFLGKHFYHSPTLTLDLRTFACEHVGLDRGYKDNGKLKEKLQPAIEELEGIGFLEPMSREDRYAKVGPGQWTITLRRRADLELADDPIDAAPLSGPEPTEQEKALIERGVTPATAAELALAHPADRIAAKVEVFDWLVDRKDRRERAAALEEQRRKVEEARRKAAEEQRARDDVDAARVRAYWDGLSAPGRERLQAEALASPALAFLVKRYRAQKDPEAAARSLRTILDGYILELLDAKASR